MKFKLMLFVVVFVVFLLVGQVYVQECGVDGVGVMFVLICVDVQKVFVLM